MTSFELKVIAFLLMLIDHLGIVLGVPLFRIIGRLAFPLFSLQVGLSLKSIPSEKFPKFLRRLIFWGLISQVPYILLINRLQFNVLLAFALSSWIIKSKNYLPIGFLVLFDYDFYGFGLILGEYLGNMGIIFLSSAYYIFRWGLNYALFALLGVIYFYNLYPSSPGCRWRGFYWLYPLHISLLVLVKLHLDQVY